MKALLMHRDRDFDPQQELPRREQAWRRERDFDPLQDLAPHERAVMQDLELHTLLSAMANGDPFLYDVGRKALFSGVHNDIETILYRQEVLKDCLRNPAVLRELYAIVVDAIEKKKKQYFGFLSRYPASILSGSVALLQMFSGALRKLKGIADVHASDFASRGLTALFAMLQKEFNDEYFASIQDHLRELRFRAGVLVSAELGEHLDGTNYVLRLEPDKRPNWVKWILGKGSPAFTFRLHERDDAGARILSEMRDRGINLVANALAQSTEHILSFFDMLRTELAFYVGCLNLHDRLATLGTSTCFPHPQGAGTRVHRFSTLRDVSLLLTMNANVVGNTVDAYGKNLVMITGANQGGKSTFLRSVGLAQLMMQAGMFVTAESFTASLCAGLFTHYKREEDTAMKSGKLDEELARMSAIVEAIRPDAMILFNESFASTNEREGSELARQIVCALLERRIKVFYVTHLYDLAHGFFETRSSDTVFLRAERHMDGTRSFQLIEGEPLQTSYGEDLYREIFAGATKPVSAG